MGDKNNQSDVYPARPISEGLENDAQQRQNVLGICLKPMTQREVLYAHHIYKGNSQSGDLAYR